MEERHVTMAIFIGILAVVGVGAQLIGKLIGPSKAGITKGGAYECGSPVIQTARSQFDIRFFMLAMIFLLFDIETVLLLPYLIQYTEFGTVGLIIAGIFFAGLVESLVYAWKKGALDWK